MQMEYFICRALGKTPGEIRELELRGLLTEEQKLFLIAGLEYEFEMTAERGPLFLL
jgi:hypothetical protein